MKHATSAALDKLEPLLVDVRRRGELREKSRGVFYRKSKAFLHFHEDADHLFADVRLGGEWQRVRSTTQRERNALLRAIEREIQ